DYYLAQTPPTSVTLEILDSAGMVIRTFNSDAQQRAAAESGAAAAEEDEDLPRRARPAPRLSADVGLNRYTWDLAYPGPRDGVTGQPGTNGPTVVPGRYTVRLRVAGQTMTQP